MNPFEIYRVARKIIRWGPELFRIVEDFGDAAHACNWANLLNSSERAYDYVAARDGTIAGRAAYDASKNAGRK
jgi:hypothetical protein